MSDKAESGVLRNKETGLHADGWRLATTTAQGGGE